MNSTRRAASAPSRRRTRVLIAAAASALMAAGALLLGAVGIAGTRVAKKVVTPARRESDTEILALDVSAQTITLAKNADTRLPGRYGLFTTGSESYVKLGSVLDESDRTVKRKLLTHIGHDASLGAAASFSGWYFDRPEQLQLPFTPELIGSSVGPCPAWLFPAENDRGDWVVQIHGRGATRAEALRAVPVFRELGYSSLLVSYRNDGEAPRSRSGTYTLGATEWRDVDAAIGFARRRGARRIVLMGWSMGGAIAFQLALSSAHRELFAGIVLDSPVIDWEIVLRYQASLLHLPKPIVGVALGALGSQWGAGLARTGERIPFDRLDIVARADELRQPVLILHSDDDGFVPSDASYDLVVARPDLVTLEGFEGARHTKLWNYDQRRWTASITHWMREHDLSVEDGAEGS